MGPPLTVLLSPLFRLLLTAALLLASVGMAGAQTPTDPAAGSPSTQPAATAAPQDPMPEEAQSSLDPEEADISITATVRARELRFETDPQVKVEFFGQPERLTEDRTERTNLPEDVQPGVTYRDIGIRLKIVSVFADIDRIVAEALGEVPARETAPAPPALQPAEVAREDRP